MQDNSTRRKWIRKHHYYFVQSYFYGFVQRHPASSLEMYSYEDFRERAEEALLESWYLVYDQIKESHPDVERIEIDKLEYSAISVDEFNTIVVITLPPPQATTESYFIGVYYHHSEDKDTVYEFRYFTLEYHDEDNSAFCELKEVQHCLISFSENLTESEFVEKIKCITNVKKAT